MYYSDSQRRDVPNSMKGLSAGHTGLGSPVGEPSPAWGHAPGAPGDTHHRSSHGRRAFFRLAQACLSLSGVNAAAEPRNGNVGSPRRSIIYKQALALTQSPKISGNRA